MATLAELESAFAALATIFRTDLAPRVNALRREVTAGDTFAEVGSEINTLRAEFDNAYQRVFEILQQAEQLPSQDGRADLIARLERSLNTNQSNNRAVLSRIEIDARDNQATQDKAAADQGTGAQSAGTEVNDAAQARDEAAGTQSPPAPVANQNADGTVTDTPATAVPTNAESSQPPGVPEVPASPSGIVSPSSAADNTTGNANTVTTAPIAATGTLQSAAVSDAQQFYVYKTVRVVSKFDGGRFTQDLEGVLLQIPAVTARRQDNVLVPTVAADTPPDIESAQPTTPRASVTAATGSGSTTVLPDEGTNIGEEVAPASDPTTFSAAQNAPPDSAGQPVPTAAPSASTGQGSATTTVGGFTIKASSGTENGIFVTVFVISRNGVQGFANDIDGIVAAAQSVQQRSLGGVVEDVQAWVSSGGAARLKQQAEAQAQPNTASIQPPINLARET